MTKPQMPNTKACFLVCEDGNEYLERFERFLGTRYDFLQSRSLSELLDQLAALVHPPAAVLLDLDFRRTALPLLVDGQGRPLAQTNHEERQRSIANQGIAILACLRQRHPRIPVMLFADLPEAQQTFLSQRFAPLTIVPSHVSMRELQSELQAVAVRSSEV